MAQRWRSRARRDPDLYEDEEAPPREQQQRRRRRAARTGTGSGSDDDDDEEEAGNEDLSLEIVARSRSRRRREEAARGGDVLSLSSGDEVDEDAVVELGEADTSSSSRKQKNLQKKKRRKEKQKKQRKGAHEGSASASTAIEKEPQVAGTQEAQTGTAESVLTENGPDAPLSDNSVLRKLLRIPRYFDPGETLLETCFNCGEEGHVAVKCPMEKRKKPCFVCGLFGHNSKQCTQGQDCFICKKGGHIAKDCPEKHNKNTQQSTFCLRCGESGHDMFGCANDYPRDDVKEIKCYVCNQKGHLCCADFSDICPKEVSCYNCAQPGHTGLGCAKQRRDTNTATTPTLCYKCGEEGHFARGCTKTAKSDRVKGESSAHSRKKGKGKKDFGTRSAPYDARKTSKRKSPLFEERRNTSHFKSKARGGWIADDADDQPYKKYKPNVWASPSTPRKQHSNHHFYSGDDYSTQSSRWQKQGFASSSATYSPNARKHSFSSSRFASNTHVRFGRS